MMATKPKNNNNNIDVVSGPSTGICPLPLDDTTDNTDDKVTTLVTTEPPVLMALNAANAQITKLTHDLSQQQRRQQKDRTLIERLRQKKEEAESRNQRLEVVASNADRRVTRLEKEKQKLENTVESLISSGERLRKAKKNNEDHYVFLIESLRQANRELEEQLLKQTKINDGRVEELKLGTVTNVLDLPSSLLLDCFLYLDLISSMIVSTLNKQCRAVVRGPGMEALYRPVLHISTSGERKNNHRRLLQQLSFNRDKLQHYTDATIIDANKFDNFEKWRDAPIELTNFQLHGLESLTISSTSSTPVRHRIIAHPLMFSLHWIMPNIQRIDFTGANFGSDNGLGSLFWPRLTKITWNGIGISDNVNIRGQRFRELHNLREMYMDDSYFWEPIEPDQFIFQKCCQNLERMSIRNARVRNARYNVWGSHTLSSVSQQELIRFVRNAPSLKWFRSDLTLDNITMLQKERPGIELLS